MVSELSLLFMSTTLVITLVLPVVLIIAYAMVNRGEKTVSAWFLGAAGFVVFQLFLRSPILSVLSSFEGFQKFAGEHYIWYAIFLGFTAGLFEVMGRVCVASILSERLTFERGVAAGLGHGSVEAILLVGITYISNLLYATMINNGTYDSVIEETLAAGADAAGLYAAKSALTDTPAYVFGLAGFERILTMICHLALSLVVCYFVAKKQTMKGVIISLAFHTVLDTGSGILSGLGTAFLKDAVTQNTVYVLTYAFMILLTALAVLAIKKIRDCWEYESQAA